MPHYTATFSKTVCNDTGHERRICQRAVEVHAPSRASALATAKARFCALERVAEWSLRADEIALQRKPVEKVQERLPSRSARPVA